MQGEKKKEENRLVEWLNSIAEASVTLVPVIALVFGIGMVNLLPPKLTTPIFYSEEDSQRFLQRLGSESLSYVPIMLVKEDCGESCERLRSEMNQHGVEYDEFDVESQYGKLFFQKAVEASGSDELPKVIVGDLLVRPNAMSVKRVVERKMETAR